MSSSSNLQVDRSNTYWKGTPAQRLDALFKWIKNWEQLREELEKGLDSDSHAARACSPPELSTRDISNLRMLVDLEISRLKDAVERMVGGLQA
jgi:hypothetical protein